MASITQMTSDVSSPERSLATKLHSERTRVLDALILSDVFFCRAGEKNNLTSDRFSAEFID
jgi:hypothetical protein